MSKRAFYLRCLCLVCQAMLLGSALTEHRLGWSLIWAAAIVLEALMFERDTAGDAPSLAAE